MYSHPFKATIVLPLLSATILFGSNQLQGDPRILSISNAMEVTFEDESATGQTAYKIYQSTDLNAWELLNFAMSTGSSATTMLPQPGDDQAKYYRIIKHDAQAIAAGTADGSAPSGTDYHDNEAPDPSKVQLGMQLFFDKILSGNENISCATCHHTYLGSGDGLSLPVGEGGAGLGVVRNTGTGSDAIHERVPRNAPQIFNLGAVEVDFIFHDGRLAVDPTQPSGFFNPAGNSLPQGLENILAAQAMFPVQSGAEMAGNAGENPIADLAEAGNLTGLWTALGQRLQGIPGYVTQFVDCFDDVDGASDITYVHAANAIAAYEMAAFRANQSPFDRYLNGDTGAMSPRQLEGMDLFYGKANCGSCHSGVLQMDHSFHAIAMPQIGPGKGDGPSGHDDFGRMRVTQNPADKYKFRTPSLRNVELTGPWGHAGAFSYLEDVVLHHLDPVNSLNAYDPAQATLPSRPDLDAIDAVVFNDPVARADLAAANELDPIVLTNDEVQSLMDFLSALTDPSSLNLLSLTPSSVPSGLPVAD